MSARGSSSPRLEPGLDVGGRFVLRRPLGEGGMGWVWEAEEPAAKPATRRVALKILKGAREEDRRRFLREVRAASAIRHPNVVGVEDVLEVALKDAADDAPPTLVMVMDLLEGETLGDVLRREQRVALPRLAAILLPVLDALEAAHAAGVVHRDLKPDNVFLAVDGVRVLDFGVAKLTASEGLAARTEALTGTGSMIGTPYYMSPEQVESERDLDARSDVWSLGVMIYECLSGVRPTEAETVGRVLKRILMADFAPIETRCPELPAPVAALVRRMLTSDREHRLRDLGEARHVLARSAGDAATVETAVDLGARAASGARPSSDPLAPTEPAVPSARADTNAAVAVEPRGRRSRARLVAGGATAAAVIAVGAFRLSPAPPSPSAPGPPSSPPVSVGAPASEAPAAVAPPSSSPPADSAPPPPAPLARAASSSSSPSSPSSSPSSSPPAASPPAAPRCAANEVTSRGHCCPRGLEWQGTHCERPLATSF